MLTIRPSLWTSIRGVTRRCLSTIVQPALSWVSDSSQTGGLSFELTDEQREIQGVARKFTTEDILPYVTELDRTGKYPIEIFNKAWSLGFLNAHIPKEYGGNALGGLGEAILMEEFSFACSGVGTALTFNTLSEVPVVQFGNEQQKKKYLGRMTEQPLQCACCVTEPNAGSDVAGIETTAVLKGDNYIINGKKAWITNVGTANWFFVLARTSADPKSPPHKSLSGFIVDADSSGITRGKKEINMGQRASDTRHVTFEDVVVPKENLVGEEGLGFKMTMALFDTTRPSVSMGAVGITRRALHEATKYAMERKTFGVPIIQHQAVSSMLAEMAINYELSRLAVLRSAWEKESGRRNTYFSSIAKAFAADGANKSAADCVQIFGGNGYNTEYPAEKLLRDAKVYKIYGGTSEIQRGVITRQITGRLNQGLI